MSHFLSTAAAVFRPGVFTGVLAIFTAMVGFYVTSVVEELRSGYTAIYSFERDWKSKTILFHLDNVSRTKRIDKANILIRCRDQRSDCFTPLNDEDYAVQTITPPNFGRPLEAENSTSDTINVCLGAIASSRSSMRFAVLSQMHTDLVALYNPWSSRCGASNPEATNILLLRPWDLHAIAAKHYFTAVGVSLLIFLVALLATGGFCVFSAMQTNKEDSE